MQLGSWMNLTLCLRFRWSPAHLSHSCRCVGSKRTHSHSTIHTHLQYVFTFSYDPDGCIHMSLAGKGKKFASRHGAAGVESVKKQ